MPDRGKAPTRRGVWQYARPRADTNPPQHDRGEGADLFSRREKAGDPVLPWGACPSMEGRRKRPHHINMLLTGF